MSDHLTTADGLHLRVRITLPPGEARARVVLIHGIGDQVDGIPYTTAAAALAARGLAVHRMELRGHGLSGGRRVYVESFADFHRDLAQYTGAVRALDPRLPVFLAGVSMGGLIVTSFALDHPEGLAGVVAVAPALGETGGSRVLLALLPVLARVIPAVRMDAGLDLDRLTRDPAMRKAYIDDDPLYQRKATPRIAVEVLAAIADTTRRAPEFTVPLLVLHGTADTLTSPAGSEAFVSRAGSADKTFKACEGAYHNLFADTNREEVFDDIAGWVVARAR
jgi:alpha-beta hydrolase superfamily lysophospholipase